MSRRARTLCLALLVPFLAVNVWGAWYAGTRREAMHAGVHVVLALVALAVGARLLRGARHPQPAPPAPAAPASAMPDGFGGSLTRLEHAVGAVAAEVGRVGEGQRELTRLAGEHVAHAARTARTDAPAARVPTPPG